jgi:hypothetical protein
MSLSYLVYKTTDVVVVVVVVVDVHTTMSMHGTMMSFSVVVESNNCKLQLLIVV